MKNAQKPDHASLNAVISRLKEGKYVIPDFQREFEWEPGDIKDLIRSVMMDYYIGSLLLWKGKEENFDALSCENVYGYSGDGRREYIVLDGQQRLTAFYYAFTAPSISLPNRVNPYFYYMRLDFFMDERFDEAFKHDWLKQRWINLLSNENEQFEKHIFPVSVIGKGGWALANWVQGYQKYWTDKTTQLINSQAADDEIEQADRLSKNALTFGEHIKSITEEYQISYIELDKDLPVDKVCDIFTQINSKGRQLDIFDLVNALLKPKGLQLKIMWREASKRLEFIENAKMNVYLLQVISIMVQDYCSPKYLYYLLPGQKRTMRNAEGKNEDIVLMPTAEAFLKKWELAVSTMEASIEQLRHPQEYGVVSSNYLPYASILPAFSAIQAYVRDIEASQQLSAQNKIRFWYWASIFTLRYSGSVESTSTRDYIDLKSWITGKGSEPEAIVEFKQRFRDLNLRTEVKKGASIYNGVFNLLVIQGAKDWLTGKIPRPGEIDDHHIVPKSWALKNETKTSINTILNRSPLTADTNRRLIGKKLPNEYLPDLIANNGNEEVSIILDSHFISEQAKNILLREPFTPDDFEEFIDERQFTLMQAIENLLIKQRLDLSPHIRELDQRIEIVELQLRRLIDEVLSGESVLIPEHILVKVKERLGKAQRRSPSMSAEDSELLSTRLEYFDLRELESVITNKGLWNEFQTLFNNKEQLITKFGQLAELRNSIRHSRAVDEINRKEGEASILWFEGILKK